MEHSCPLSETPWDTLLQLVDVVYKQQYLGEQHTIYSYVSADQL